MPSAGRIVPLTSPAGMFTTKMHSPASTMTLTSMLMKNPKKAFRSPRVQIGTSGAPLGRPRPRTAVSEDMFSPLPCSLDVI